MGWNIISRWREKDNIDANIEVSKKGQNYFSVFKVGNEVILTIISPPVVYGSGFDTGGKVSAIDPSVNVDVKRNIDIKYDQPYVLFNHNNKAGLTLENVIPTVESKLKEKDASQELFKVDYNALKTALPHELKGEKQITVGSTIAEISEKDILLRPNPRISEKDKQCLKLILRYTVDTLYPNQETYRAQIFLYDPKRKTLKIKASYNMEGYQDEDIEIGIEQGGSGKAFSENNIVVNELCETYYDQNSIG